MRKPFFSKHLCRASVIWALLLIVISGPTAFAAKLSGKFTLVMDADNERPKDKAVMTLQFSSKNAVTLKASQPGEKVTAKGTFAQNENTIVVSLPEFEIGNATPLPFEYNGRLLVLPFTVFNADKERQFSLWQKRAPKTVAEVLENAAFAARITNNESQRREIDTLATANQDYLQKDLADAYYRQGVILQLADYLHEAMYAYLMASQLKPDNGLYLNNLAVVLMGLGDLNDAEVLLKWSKTKFPKFDEVHANYGIAMLRKGNCAAASASLTKAIALTPDTGSFEYAMGKAQKCQNKSADAVRWFRAAFEHGVAGDGREGDPANATAAGSVASAGNSGLQGGVNAKAKKTKSPKKSKNNKEKQIPPEWVGHYEADYIRAETSDVSLQGSGPATTHVQLRSLGCATEFSMDIYADGTVRGQGTILYSWLGNAMNIASGFAGPLDMFFSTIKDGGQKRNWVFSGTVDQSGRIEIKQKPTERLDLLNVGQWQKSPPWTIIPPVSSMAGPFEMQVATEVKGPPSVQILDHVFELNDRVIKKVHFYAYIYKSDADVSPECKKLEVIKPTCKASEYIKANVNVGMEGTASFGTSVTAGSGTAESTNSMGASYNGFSASMSKSGAMTLSMSGMGQAVPLAPTCSVSVDPANNSSQIAVGIGVDTSQVLPGPFKISEKIELIYDNACGFGIRASGGANVDPLGSASVEGAIFFRARP